jgi:ubiquinone/menaquinone biosynthesis C-methylase UbiE
MQPETHTVQRAGTSEYWQAIHSSPRLAVHAAIYTWMAGQLPAGWVLDLGSEFGFGSLLISETNPSLHVIGVDVDLSALRYSRRTLFISRLINADAHMLPFNSECLSGICLINLFNMLEEPDKVVSEVWRVLKPGGMAIVSIPAEGMCRHGQPDPQRSEQLVATLKSCFTEVITPEAIQGSLPSFPTETFFINQPASLMVAFCRKAPHAAGSFAY